MIMKNMKSSVMKNTSGINLSLQDIIGMPIIPGTLCRAIITYPFRIIMDENSHYVFQIPRGLIMTARGNVPGI